MTLVAGAVALSAGCGRTALTDSEGATACGTSGTLCAGSCVDLQSDNAECGTCGTACGAGEVCSQGKCGTSCGGGTTLCGSSCVDTKIDSNNCGGCGAKCSAGELCSNGTCGQSCGTGQILCAGDGSAPYCAKPDTDNANCGACGIACGIGEVCEKGVCASACASTDGGVETLCKRDGGAPYCAKTDTDNANCGSCGIACGVGEVCEKGVCANACAAADGGVETLCKRDGGAPYCAKTDTDNANCGSCGNVCIFDEKCIASACRALTALNATVLIVYASPYESDVHAQLTGLSLFATVDEFNASTGTPTLAQLEQYDAVFLYSDNPGFKDATTLGNNLADYWDAGGTVVEAVFANTNTGTTLPVAGRWVSGGYNLINVTLQAEPPEPNPLIIVDSSSRYVAGVSTLTAGAGYRSTGAPVGGATAVAEWGDGVPLIVVGTKGGRQHVELNFYPPSSAIRPDFWVGDGTTILKNALLYK